MSPLLLGILAIIWLVGTWLRIYRQARFFQIEEYMSLRYLRWLMQSRELWLPIRPIVLWFIGSALAVFLGEAPGSQLPIILMIVFTVIAVIPSLEGEVKKAFIRTQRATRILGASFMIATIGLIILYLIQSRLPLSDIAVAEVPIASGIGLLVFLFAPIWLVLGNMLMIPVEATFRRRFLSLAKSVMEDVQPTVIGITGSYGKTTTKHFLQHILSARYRVYATPKSYNTLMGISLAINQDVADDYSIEYFISEMGAYVPGEIERICQLTPPHIGIITSVGPQHLERFGTLENTSIAKYELIKGLPPDGTAMFNWDNEYVRKMFNKGYPENRISVSKELSVTKAKSLGIRFVASNIEESLSGIRFTVTDTTSDESSQIETSLYGEHNVTNLLLVIAVAIEEGLTLRDIAIRARTLQPAESRLVRQTTDAGITILNDAYSANPEGAKSALKVLGLHQTGKRLLITPGMVELGDLQESENRKLGQEASQYATDVILVGKTQTEPILSGLVDEDFDQDHIHVLDTLTEAVDWYKQHLETGDTVLFLNDLPDTY